MHLCPNTLPRPLIFLLMTLIASGSSLSLSADEKSNLPKKGEKIENFELMTLKDKKVKLYDVTQKGPVVLVVLRGYPGYQCPLCSKQVADFISLSKEFKKENASVLLVYPGPGDELKNKANAFIKGKELPENFKLLLDPNYHFLEQFSLRWDAKRETSYPSTFVIDRENMVTFSKVSKSHGGRTKAKEILKEVKKSN